MAAYFTIRLTLKNALEANWKIVFTTIVKPFDYHWHSHRPSRQSVLYTHEAKSDVFTYAICLLLKRFLAWLSIVDVQWKLWFCFERFFSSCLLCRSLVDTHLMFALCYMVKSLHMFSIFFVLSYAQPFTLSIEVNIDLWIIAITQWLFTAFNSLWFTIFSI